jgi:hypothetical protein
MPISVSHEPGLSRRDVRSGCPHLDQGLDIWGRRRTHVIYQATSTQSQRPGSALCPLEPLGRYAAYPPA